MIRFFEIAIVAVTIAMAVSLYAFKYDTSHVASRIRNLEAEIAEERAALNVLNAEWSLLNQPERIQKLASEHLELEPLRPEQIKSYADIPVKPPAEAMDDLVQRSLDSLARFAPAADGSME